MTSDPYLPDDEATRALARALHAEVDQVEVSGDSLARIYARTAAVSGRTAWWWIAPLAAAAVVAVVATGIVLLPERGSHTATPPATGPTGPVGPSTSVPPPSSEAVKSSPARSPSSSAASHPTGSPHATKTGTAPSGCLSAGHRGYAYFVSDLNGQGPRLYRAPLTTSCNLGIEEALSIPAGKDPDYVSPWPAGTRVLGVTVSGEVATVNLSAFPQTDAATETAAVQQLVWTVTANQPSVSAVRLLVNGAAPVGNVDWTEPVRRATELTTISNVWILSPLTGAVKTSPVTVRVYGTGYEGQVPLKVFQDGVEVASGYVTTEMGAFAEAETTFDLAPGTYELRAYNDSGADDTLTLWDSKVFTVQ